MQTESSTVVVEAKPIAKGIHHDGHDDDDAKSVKSLKSTKSSKKKKKKKDRSKSLDSDDEISVKSSKSTKSSRSARKGGRRCPSRSKSMDSDDGMSVKSTKSSRSSRKGGRRSSKTSAPKKMPKRSSLDDSTASMSSISSHDRKTTAPPLPEKNPKPEEIKREEAPPKQEQEAVENNEPDYLDPDFVPKTMEERKKMLIARAKKEAEVEEELHRKHLEAAKLKAQADLQLRKAEVLAKIRNQMEGIKQKEKIRELSRNNSNKALDEKYFGKCLAMHGELVQRAEDFKESLLEQERQGLIMLRRTNNDDNADNQTPN